MLYNEKKNYYFGVYWFNWKKETENAEKEIEKFKINSSKKAILISEEIASNIIKDIFGEDLNKSSLKAAVSEITKEYKN